MVKRYLSFASGLRSVWLSIEERKSYDHHGHSSKFSPKTGRLWSGSLVRPVSSCWHLEYWIGEVLPGRGARFRARSRASEIHLIVVNTSSLDNGSLCSARVPTIWKNWVRRDSSSIRTSLMLAGWFDVLRFQAHFQKLKVELHRL